MAHTPPFDVEKKEAADAYLEKRQPRYNKGGCKIVYGPERIDDGWQYVYRGQYSGEYHVAKVGVDGKHSMHSGLDVGVPTKTVYVAYNPGSGAFVGYWETLEAARDAGIKNNLYRFDASDPSTMELVD